MVIIPPIGVQDINPTNKNDSIPFDINQSLSGKLIDWKSPVLEISFDSVKNKRFKALISTGAWDNHVSLSLLQQLNINESTGMKIGSHPTIGNIQMPSFNIKFNINKVDYKFNEQFNLMVSSFTYPLILGTNFLSKCKSFCIESNTSKFILSI